MKISKRIFSLLVSLLVITSSVGVATATETTETTDGKIYHADLSSMYDMDAIANEGDELDSATWMNGHSVSETQNGEKVTIYKGFPSTLFNSEDGYVSFRFIEATPKVANPNSSERSHWNFSTKSDRNFKFKIPVDGLKGKVNDSVHIAKNTETTKTTVQLSSEQKSVNAIRFAFFQFNATSTVTAKINYNDNTSESYTQSFRGDTRGADYCLGIYSNTNVFKCCYTKFSNVGIDLENGKAVKSTTDYYDNTWGIRGYEIPVAEGKTPVSVTLSATNDIALFALAECELLNNEMQSVIDEVNAYEKGIEYTSAQIEKIELAKEYADVLKERNALSTEDETTVNSLYTTAVKQKDMKGTIHLDISDKYNADTIASAGDTVGNSWFDGYTGFSGNFDGVVASAFGNNELFNATTYVNDNGDMVKQDETVEVYIPNVGRKGGENDAVAVWGEKTLEVDLHNVVTEKIYYVANNSETFQNTATIYYTDGTTEKVDSNGTNCASTYYSNKNDKVAYLWLGGTFASKGTDNVITTSGSHTVGYIVYNVAVDKTKVVDKVVFKNTNTSKPVFYYSVSQVPVTLPEMTTAIETAKALNEKTGMLTSDEITAIKNAKIYASTLLEAGIGTASDYAFLDTLFAKAQKQVAISGVTHIDISDKLNASTIGKAGDTVPENWFGDATISFSNEFGGLPPFDVGKDYIAFDKYDNCVAVTNGTIEGYIPESRRATDKADSVMLEKDKTSLTLNLSNVLTKNINFVANAIEDNINITVKYSDNTELKQTLKIRCKNQATYNIAEYPYIVGIRHIAWQNLQKNTSGVLATGKDVNNWNDNSNGLVMYKLDLDKDKIPVSITFENASTRPVFVYDVAQVPVTYTEMKTALEAGIENGVLTSEDEAKAELLAKYKSTLVEYGVCEATDYPEVEVYTKQADAQKTSYVDLTEYLNADLMVKAGDTYEENNTLARETVLFDGSNLTGTLTVNTAPSKSYAPDADQNEIGRTYKLSGAYNGKGNDVVQVKKDDENVKTVTIAMPETIRTVKGIGVILDCYTGAGGAEDATKSYAAKVPVTVNYEGGTSEDVTVNLLSSEGYHYSKFYANAGKTGRMDLETGTIGNSKNGQSGFNSPFFYSSNVEFDTEKTVESLTFKSISGCDYNIIAISQFVQSNAELQGIVDSYSENESITGITEVSEVTEENADDVIKFFGSIVELTNRGFAGFEDDVESFESLVARAKALKNGDTGFTATVTIDEDGSNQKATFTMSNLTDSDQTYVLVIAAYVGNKLVGVEASNEVKKVTAGTTDVTDSISMAKSTESGVTYKAFVWESLTSLKPLGTSN